jgi:hypothetical protein
MNPEGAGLVPLIDPEEAVPQNQDLRLKRYVVKTMVSRVVLPAKGP